MKTDVVSAGEAFKSLNISPGRLTRYGARVEWPHFKEGTHHGR